MVLSYILIGLVTVTYGLYIHFTRTFNYWRDRNVVGPDPVPLFGNIMDSALRRTHSVFITKKIYFDYPQEKVVGVYKMTSPALLIRDPEIVKHVMIKDFDYFLDRGVSFGNDALGANLFHADPITWRNLRHKLTPIFTSGKLKNMFYLMNKTGVRFIEHVQDLIETESELEVSDLMGTFTMAAIASCAFGLELNMKEKNDVMDTLKRINKQLLPLNFATELDLLYPGILNKLGVSLFTELTRNFFKSLVSQIITERNGEPGNRNDFMDLLLELKHTNAAQENVKSEGDNANFEITEDIMASQAFVFYAGAYETSCTTLSYMLYRLALHPEIQENVVAEMHEVLERHGGGITYDMLKELIYFDRVLCETLRVHAPGDALVRRAAADYKIPGTDITLQKGQCVIVNQLALHNDEKYWPNPSYFDPDRFSPENTAKRHPAVYLPFGIGPRNCIGMRFAKTQIRLVMLKLLTRFRVEAIEHTHQELRYNTYNFIAFPTDGIKVKFVRR